ncbi:unnamed protein product [Caenorhabditis auriculariae]|uniref:Uncharacterized protein n=1 Tax=Caenorhabditis auriculariae TaxID=2777116 RepID=A0A8S1HDB8_9PELO|nr:unnamed protein product [Caenorhabditis auriculariae]
MENCVVVPIRAPQCLEATSAGDVEDDDFDDDISALQRATTASKRSYWDLRSQNQMFVDNIGGSQGVRDQPAVTSGDPGPVLKMH